MGRYDGILIMTDMDGTLASGGVVTEENVAAIRRFQSEGGRFTVCSGRHSSHFEKFRDLFLPNAPICAYNGALIVDTDGNIISESFLGEDALAIALMAVKRDLFARVLLYTRENGAPTTCETGDFISNFGKYRIMHHYKIVLVGKTEEATLLGREFMKENLPESYVAVRSWPVGLEILNSNATKDKALTFLRSYTAARLVIAAGDFENDIEMLRVADVGYAVDNADPEVKDAADRITVRVDESAIAKIIEELDCN